jgi:hypothetical protein
MQVVLCHGRLRKGWPTRCMGLSKTHQNFQGVPLHMARESGLVGHRASSDKTDRL